MQSLELFFDHKSKGHFTLEDINILNDQLHHYYWVDTENPTKDEEMIEFKNYIANFKEINEVFDNVKDDLLFHLNEYMEKDTKKDDLYTYYSESVAEQEGHSNEDVYELTEKLRELSNDEIIQVLTALMEARTLFDMFIVSDPMRELRRYKQRAEVFEQGYEVYKKGYETLDKFVSGENLNKIADKIGNEVKERIDLVKDAYIDAVIGKQTVIN